MTIKIVSNTNVLYPELVWYANRIGETFEVKTEEALSYYVHIPNDEQYDPS